MSRALLACLVLGTVLVGCASRSDVRGWTGADRPTSAEAGQLLGQDVHVFEVPVPHGTRAYAVEFGGAQLLQRLSDDELGFGRDLLRRAGLDRLRVTMAIGGEDCPPPTTRLAFHVNGSTSRSCVRLPRGRAGTWSTTTRTFDPVRLDAWVLLYATAPVGVGIQQFGLGRPLAPVQPQVVALRVVFLSTGDWQELDRLLPSRPDRPAAPAR